MDSIKEKLELEIPAEQKAGEKPPEQERKKMIIVRRMREHDDSEPEVKLESELEIEWKLRQILELGQDLKFAAARHEMTGKVVSACADRLAKANAYYGQDFAKFMEVELPKVKGKTVVVSLAKAGMPDVEFALKSTAQAAGFEVTDADALEKFYTGKATPVDTQLGCFEYVAAFWKLGKAKLNALCKLDLADGKLGTIPGVKVVNKPDSLSWKER